MTFPRVFVLLGLLVSFSAQAQEYLGIVRTGCVNAQNKTGHTLVVKVGSETLVVRPFEARTATDTSLAPTAEGFVVFESTCDGHPQRPISCPARTNRLLVDRAQGGQFVDFICLRR
jgi:hypothetical protein